MRVIQEPERDIGIQQKPRFLIGSMSRTLEQKERAGTLYENALTLKLAGPGDVAPESNGRS